MAFKKGISGNPAGRPKIHASVADLRRQIYNAMPEIVAALVTQAKSGDVNAAKLLLERALPQLKPVREPITFDICENDGMGDISGALVGAMSRGEVEPETCAAALELIKEQRKLDRGQKLDRMLSEL